MSERVEGALFPAPRVDGPTPTDVDALTGLPTRSALHRHVELLAARGDDPFAVVLLDLDHFRLVNEIRGAASADAVLRDIAAALLAAAGPTAFVARFGGDEFAVVVPVDGTDATSVADRLREAVLTTETDVVVNASAGLVVCPPSPFADALRHADAAMYEAKRLGRARVHVFDASVRERAASMLELSTALHRALSSDADELAVHYQPIVSLASDALVAVEAFARWRHPSLGPVPPAHFVDVAAHAGLGGELDMWAMRTAFSDFAGLRRSGVVGDDVRVSVNLTGAELSSDAWVRDVLSALAAAEISPRQLMVEVSSAVVRRDSAGAARTLTRLREQGVWVAIDDFGGAASSIADLRVLPVDVVKIDRVFVRNIVSSRDDLAVVAALVDLAHALGVTVVAEGVETPDQRRLLDDLRCDQAQGYLWSTPVPAATLADALYDVPRAGRAAATIGRLRAGGSPSAADDGAVGREHGLLRMFELKRDGASPTTIAAALNAEGFRTPAGQRWHRSTVAKVLAPAR